MLNQSAGIDEIKQLLRATYTSSNHLAFNRLFFLYGAELSHRIIPVRHPPSLGAIRPIVFKNVVDDLLFTMGDMPFF